MSAMSKKNRNYCNSSMDEMHQMGQLRTILGAIFSKSTSVRNEALDTFVSVTKTLSSTWGSCLHTCSMSDELGWKV